MKIRTIVTALLIATSAGTAVPAAAQDWHGRGHGYGHDEWRGDRGFHRGWGHGGWHHGGLICRTFFYHHHAVRRCFRR